MTHTTTWNPASYATNARFVSDLGEPLLELLAGKPGETILDLGCGDGALTEKILAAGCTVYGCDASLAQLLAARNRGATVFVMDGQQTGLKRRFDAVFTNAALHWMKQAEKVVEGVAEFTETRRPFRRRVRRQRQCRNHPPGVAWRAAKTRHRSVDRRPVVLRRPARVRGAVESPWLHGRLYRIDPAPDKITRRYSRLARSLRSTVQQSRGRVPTSRIFR